MAWQPIQVPFTTDDVELFAGGGFRVGQLVCDQSVRLSACKTTAFESVDKRAGEGEPLVLCASWFRTERYKYVSGQWYVFRPFQISFPSIPMGRVISIGLPLLSLGMLAASGYFLIETYRARTLLTDDIRDWIQVQAEREVIKQLATANGGPATEPVRDAIQEEFEASIAQLSTTIEDRINELIDPAGLGEFLAPDIHSAVEIHTDEIRRDLARPIAVILDRIGHPSERDKVALLQLLHFALAKENARSWGCVTDRKPEPDRTPHSAYAQRRPQQRGRVGR